MVSELRPLIGKIKKVWKNLKFNWIPNMETDFWVYNGDLYYLDNDEKTGLPKSSKGWVLIKENFTISKIRGLKY